MGVVLFVLLAIGAALYYSMSRGRLTVRAAGYLLMLGDGATQVEANRFASSIDMYEAAKRKPEVMSCVKDVFGGSQLALISLARLNGFSG